MKLHAHLKSAFTVVVCVAGLRAHLGASSTAGREQLLFDFGWRFHLGDAADPDHDFGFGAGLELRKAGDFKGPAALDFDDHAWASVQLPHDWAVDLPFDESMDKAQGFKPLSRKAPATSIGWYRRVFDVPATDDGRCITLQFDGVFRDAVVWVNGFRIGRNEDGYGGFRFELNDYLHYGGKNVLLVRVDATAHEGWWYEGAGIYRHVWLIKTSPLHLAFDATQILTEVGDSHAKVTVRMEVVNESDESNLIRISSAIIGPDGEVVSETSGPITLPAHSTTEPSQVFAVVNPRLWSLEAPNLYRLATTVLANDGPLDSCETTFGIRTIRFEPENGFFLNGKHVEIKGVCCHQDHAGVGIAIPDRLQIYRLETLKKYGVNAYRASHNTPTREVLDACDRLGILVVDEVRKPGSTPEALHQLTSLIRRDRNHPCIILWSMANEERVQNRDDGYRIGKSMKRAIESQDPSRPVTAAMNSDSADGFSKVTDIRGFNYHENAIDKYHREHPAQPIIGSEVASSRMTRGIYETNQALGYISCMETNPKIFGRDAEDWWSFYAVRPFLAGGFVWSGFDYRGEPSPFAWPVISSQYGFLDTCGFPKDDAFYYLAWWTDKPMVHLSPHWNWAGREGQEVTVRADSNCEGVELFLNGQSLGRKPMPRNSHLEWKVAYAPGELIAKGYDDNKEAAAASVRTTGAATRIALTPDRTSLSSDAEDVVVINVAILDRRGDVVPTADNEVTFAINGGGTIIGVGNGNPASHEADHANHRKAFTGYCQVIVQSTGRPGQITVSAESAGLSGATVTIDSLKTERRPSVATVE